MTVLEFIDAFVCGHQKTEVVQFLYEDTDAQVFYNGDPSAVFNHILVDILHINLYNL